MELYVLDTLLRRSVVVDDFESLIWTIRYADSGDVELDIKSTPGVRSIFTSGTLLGNNESDRVMQVLTVQDSETADGKSTLKVKGKSLENVLKDRVAKYSMDDISDWVITDTPGNVARTMFDHVVRNHSLDPADAIPFLIDGTLYPDNSNPEPLTPITWTQKPDSLYTAIKGVCDPYDLGFRLYKYFDASHLYFDIYTGNDLTTRQTTYPPVIFGPKLDSIQNTTELTSIDGSKNVAYVFSAAGHVVVLGDHVDPDIEGFERRVLVVNSSVAEDDPDANTLMIEEGTQALNNAKASHLFDGEINQYNFYQYGVNYNLGDIVELRNRDGVITYKRVTEVIMASDTNGDRIYPTLAAGSFLGANTWVDWNRKSTVWSDYETDMDSTWDTQ